MEVDTPRPPRRPERGFTLIELMVTVAIMGIVAALAWWNGSRLIPRSAFAGTANEMRGVMHLARQQAIDTGHDVAILVFPDYPTPTGTGRLLLYEDGNYDFFTCGSAVDFGGYNPAVPAAGNASRVLKIYDLPRGVVIGPAGGPGLAPLPAPFNGVPVNLRCTFCGVDRGAVAFDMRGRARFYQTCGAPMNVPGGSITFDGEGGRRTFPVSAGAGAMRPIISR